MLYVLLIPLKCWYVDIFHCFMLGAVYSEDGLVKAVLSARGIKTCTDEKVLFFSNPCNDQTSMVNTFFFLTTQLYTIKENIHVSLYVMCLVHTF